MVNEFGLLTAPTPSENSRMNLQSRRGHSYAHQHYHHHAQPVQVQEIRGHSNHHHAHYHHHAQPVQVQEIRGNMHRGRRGNMHRGPSNFHAPRGNIHNLPPRAFPQEEVASFRNQHSDIQLDIDDMSYEVSLLCIV